MGGKSKKDRAMYLTQPNTSRIDPDDELIAWQESQAEDLMKQAQNQSSHRCPSDMPPCPVCEQIYDDEDFNM